ncbi:MAG: hypothetical protein KA184_10505 [Candidatus Hydrogenedentes bacterium]|nr:hypothetical protein [Candidatus Hydrogenedentota bacterium]
MGTGPKIAIAVGVVFAVVFGLPMLAMLKKGGIEAAKPKNFTATDLTNTSWEVNVMGHTASIDLNAGGQAVANVPPPVIAMAKQMMNMDIPPQVPGTWSVTDNQLVVGVDFMGMKQQVKCEIRGQHIYYKEGQEEKEARRLR